VAPHVSIVILSYRRPDLVENLIRSIWLHTHGLRYEIIVVDNGSPLGEHDLKSEFRERVTCIRLKYNQYIGDAYNIGVENARSPYLVLMNNDIVVEPNWLQPLITPLVHEPFVGATGPKFLYPTGQLQEAGAVIDSEGRSVQLGKRGNATAPEFNRRREIDYCTGATIALRRESYIGHLGYDWRWSPGYYEDVDLCLKLRELGQATFYIPESTVFHIESITMSDTPPAANMQMAVDVNRRRLVAKWGRLLGQSKPAQPSSLSTVDEVVKRFERIRAPLNKEKKTIAAFFPYEFIPGGGEKFILSILEQFSHDAEVVLIFEGEQSILRIMSVLTDLGFPSLVFKLMTLKEAEASAPFDIFLLLGNEVFPVRSAMGRKSYFVCQFPFPAPHEFLSRFHEMRLYRNFESYLVYSEYVERHLKARLEAWREQDIKINVLPPTIDDIGVGDSKKQEQIIGVGRFFSGGHNKRHDIMIDALQAVMTQSPQRNLKLCLAGALHKEGQHVEHLARLRERAHGLPVEFHVDEWRETLNTHYRCSKIYYHTTGWGVNVEENPEQAEHFGISIIEAMSAGCIPIVYSLGGPIEIVKHGINGVAVGSVDEMADWTLRLLDGWDSIQVQEMRRNAVSTAKTYGKEAFRGRLLAIIPSDSV
jgi:GT2 family glycosyltransferase/glycosyltransferase involved in cell wall biosynthesis